MAKQHVYFERDWSTGNLYRIERGELGTKFRVLVRGMPEKKAPNIDSLIRQMQSKASPPPDDPVEKLFIKDVIQ